MAPDFSPTPFSALTKREHDVMRCIAQGMPNKIISCNLGIAQRTVEAHRASVFRKLNIRNATQLANYVWQQCPAQEARRLTAAYVRVPGQRLVVHEPPAPGGSARYSQASAGRDASSSIGSTSACRVR